MAHPIPVFDLMISIDAVLLNNRTLKRPVSVKLYIFVDNNYCMMKR